MPGYAPPGLTRWLTAAGSPVAPGRLGLCGGRAGHGLSGGRDNGRAGGGGEIHRSWTSGEGGGSWMGSHQRDASQVGKLCGRPFPFPLGAGVGGTPPEGQALRGDPHRGLAGSRASRKPTRAVMRRVRGAGDTAGPESGGAGALSSRRRFRGAEEART